MKKCSHCKAIKPESEFQRKSGEKRQSQCKSCRKVVERIRYSGLREKYQELKAEVLQHYSGNGGCVCCGEKQLDFLNLDHVKDNGAGDRKRGTGRGIYFYRWLKQSGFPTGLQTLCSNCNSAKQINRGFCPHNPKRDLREPFAV